MPSSQTETLQELLEKIADALDLDATVSVREEDDTITGVVEGEELGLFIGHHGQTIEAVQHLAQRIAGEGERGGEGQRILGDAAGCRAGRGTVLQPQADEAAGNANRTGEGRVG